jgi:predicted aspartyl protease
MLGLRMNVTIPVEFDGGSLTAVFDTGARDSYLTRAGAHKAGITNRQLDQDPLRDVTSIDGRKAKARIHNVPEFVVGEELIRNFPFVVDEQSNRDQHYDMLLGMDWISKHHLWLSYTTDSLYIDSGEKKPANWKTVTLPAS